MYEICLLIILSAGSGRLPLSRSRALGAPSDSPPLSRPLYLQTRADSPVPGYARNNPPATVRTRRISRGCYEPPARFEVWFACLLVCLITSRIKRHHPRQWMQLIKRDIGNRERADASASSDFSALAEQEATSKHRCELGVAVARNTRHHRGDVSGDTSLNDALILHRARWAQRTRPPYVQGPHPTPASPSSSPCS